MNDMGEQIDRMVAGGRPMAEIEARIDELPIGKEAKATMLAPCLQTNAAKTETGGSLAVSPARRRGMDVGLRPVSSRRTRASDSSRGALIQLAAPRHVESGKRVVNLGAGSGPFSRFSGPDRLERAVQGRPAP